MVTRKDWEEFRSSGLLWFINRTLHLFGWAIVFDYDDKTKELKEVYPARCKFRGFSSNGRGSTELSSNGGESHERSGPHA